MRAGAARGAGETGAHRLARLVRAGAVALCGLLLLGHGAGLAAAVLAGGAGTAARAAGGLLLGAAAADLVTGLVHWACDSYGSERTPALGPALIRAFREHHRRPRAMLEHDFAAVNGEPAAAAALALAAAALPAAQELLQSAPFAYGFALALTGVSALGNQLHRWAHTTAAPRLVRRMQRRGLVLSPRAHARHHRPPHTGAYCTATGWCNPVLDALGVWRALERGVERATGVAPRAGAPPAARPDPR